MAMDQSKKNGSDFAESLSRPSPNRYRWSYLLFHRKEVISMKTKKNTYGSHRLRLEKLKRQTMILFIFARLLRFILWLVTFYE